LDLKVSTFIIQKELLDFLSAALLKKNPIAQNWWQQWDPCQKGRYYYKKLKLVITLREIQDPQQTLPTDSSLPKYLRRVQKVFEETQKFTSCTERTKNSSYPQNKERKCTTGCK
jgi:hypothetical protein